MKKTVFILIPFLWLIGLCNIVFATDKQPSIFQSVILGNKATRYIINEKNDQNLRSFEITAEGDNSASGLYVDNPIPLLPDYPSFEWSWLVTKLQDKANIAVKEKEDFAASIQFIFGKKSLLAKPKILNYAWVGNNAEIGSVIKSPRIENHFRTIILNNETTVKQSPQTHKRDLLEDYKKAYGEYPTKELSVFGVFTDNDQTGQTVKALYQIKLKNE